MAAALLATGTVATTASATAASKPSLTITSTGLTAGQVKHVWLIILENKSYDATFTGLNQNSYLWKTLPKQGVLLKNYYGTGHFSQDNYVSLVSGQAPNPDVQSDCPVRNSDFSSNAAIVRTGGNRGQALSLVGPNGPVGTNGCTYPRDVPTLFNQLDAAKKSWKGYAQDLGNQPGREDAVCGGPGTAANNPTTNPTVMTATPATPFPPGVTSFTGAQANDQYVAKHFPFPWFHALTGTVQADGTTRPGLTKALHGTDCDAGHIANLDSPSHGLFHDLQKASTTPAFSWITPNNCSDAHDAVCKGNNLSGAFTAGGKPIYQKGAPNPEAFPPVNYTGGLYASDLFLKYYVTMIEKSPAFKDGGLIDITFDEGFPAFTYTGNSFNNANAYGPTKGLEAPVAASTIKNDAAGETLHGKTVHSEPTGPNTPLKADANGNQLYPGPGYNAWINRPPACTATAPALVPANCVPGIVLGGSGVTPAARNDHAAANTSSTYVLDQSIVATDAGRQVTDTVDTTGPGGTSPIPANTFVGTVSDTGPQRAATPTGSVVDGSFQLVDQAGNPVTPTGTVSAITLSAEGAPGFLTAGQTPDPLYDAKDPTPGGGLTGSVLISPLIKPGTTSSVYYNHYSWLRTMEDIFSVSKGKNHVKLAAGVTVSGGVDKLGHLGFAAQPGLAPFGKDVFNNAAVTKK